MGEMKIAQNILVGKREGKTPLGIPRRRYEDNIRIDVKGIVWEDMNWIDLTQDRGQWRDVVNR
jgi:hypothetical protein